jgi:hypothetical protein
MKRIASSRAVDLLLVKYTGMKKSLTTTSICLAIGVLLSACSTTPNQLSGRTTASSPVSQDLFNTVAHLDAALFQAFNSCNIERFTALMADDLEFYHDQSGLMHSPKTQAEALKIRCAEQDKNGILRRELVKGSLQVYPIKNYGAVEIGVHNFYRTLPGQKEKLTTTGKFIQIWREKNGEWKVSRIVSYGHEEIR